MALTINKRDRKSSVGITDRTTRWFRVAASKTVFFGAVVFRDAAGDVTLTPVDATTVCLGIAGDNYTNTVASPTADKVLRVEHGQTELLVVTGLGAGDVGKKVYATDDETLDFVATTNLVGTVDSIVDIATDECMVLVAPGVIL